MRIEVQANSPEWLIERGGCLTASCLHKVIKRLQRASNGRQKGDYSESRDKYMREIISERLSGLAIEHFVTPFMEQGTRNEPIAAEKYGFAYDLDVNTNFGFALHPSIEFFGASLDATVGDDGGAEFKCFKPDNHLEIIENDCIPEENIAQVLGEMACYELEWCDWVSYCGFGKWPKELQLYRKRLRRKDFLMFNGVQQTVDSHIADIESEAKRFLEDVILKLGKYALAAKKHSAAEAYEGMENLQEAK